MPDGPKSPIRPSRFGSLLVLATVSTGFTPVSIGVLGPYLRDDFDISTAHIGLFTTCAFIAAALASIVAGRIADRLDGRTLLLLVFCCSSVAIFLTSVSPVYSAMLAAMVVAGVAQATGSPATNRLLSAGVLVSGRGYWLGLKQSGVQIGAFVGGLLLPTGATIFGWRVVLSLFVLIPLFGIALTLRTLPVGTVPPEPGMSVRQLSTSIVRNASGRLGGFLMWLSVYAFLMGAAVSSVAVFLPLFAVDEVGVSPQTAGFVAATVGFVATAGRVTWAGRVERVRRLGRPLGAIGFLSLAAMSLLVSSQWLGVGALWAGAITVGATLMSWNSVGNFAIVRDVPAQVGHASGVMQAAFYCGFIVAPIAFGAMVDAGGGYLTAWFAMIVCVAGAASVAASGALSSVRKVVSAST